MSPANYQLPMYQGKVSFLPAATKAALTSQVMIAIDSPYYFYVQSTRKGLPHSSSPHQLELERE